MYLYFFTVSCYYIICFGCLMGINMLFYIIFGTNLLTEGPVPVSIFFAYFRVLQKRNTKRSPIDVPIFDDFLWTKRRPRSIKVGPEDIDWARASPGGFPEGAQPTRARQAPLACPPRWPPAPPLCPINSQIFRKPAGLT